MLNADEEKNVRIWDGQKKVFFDGSRKWTFKQHLSYLLIPHRESWKQKKREKSFKTKCDEMSGMQENETQIGYWKHWAHQIECPIWRMIIAKPLISY